MAVTQGHHRRAPVVQQARAERPGTRSPLQVALSETVYQRRTNRARDLRPIATHLDTYAHELAAEVDERVRGNSSARQSGV